MTRLVVSLVSMMLAVSAGTASAAGEGPLLDAQTDLSNKASLQRGAKYFTNYCAGCHGATYMRYSRLAKDLELSEEVVEETLLFGDQQIGETMEMPMDAELAEQWFGKAPPDLSLIARSKGVDYLYTLLKTYYVDESTATGWNNLAYPNTAMPHVLWQAQGIPVLEEKEHKEGEHEDTEDHGEKAGASQLALLEQGSLTPQAYDAMVLDIVSFLEYVSEPAKLVRFSIGWKVLLFLAAFTFLAWLLKREFWKDVH